MARCRTVLSSKVSSTISCKCWSKAVRRSDVVGPSAWGVAADCLDMNTLLMTLEPDKVNSRFPSGNPMIDGTRNWPVRKSLKMRSILMYCSSPSCVCLFVWVLRFSLRLSWVL
jgi:hypothetical protein